MILWTCTCADIARFLGLNKSTVHRYAKRLGIERPRSKAKRRVGMRGFTQAEAQKILLWHYSHQ